MGERFKESMERLLKFLALGAPGVLGIWLMPVSELVHETHGFIGIIFGMMFCFSMWLTSRIIWIITGDDWLDDVMDF